MSAPALSPARAPSPAAFVDRDGRPVRPPPWAVELIHKAFA